MKYLIIALTATLLSAAPGLAQQTAEPPSSGTYADENCGSWVNDVWVPNANCTTYVTIVRHDSMAGTITSVKGHLVTVQQTARSLVINDQPALDHQRSGKVAVGRQIVAYGYWIGGTFYATAIY